MKNLFIPVKYKQNLNKSVINQIKKLPNKIAICYSIQFEKQALMLRDLIKNKEIIWFGQILGCSKPDMPKNTQAIILIGQGKFHSISLEHETKIPVYQIENNKLLKASEQEVKKLEKRQKASYVNYLNQNEIGVIITNKPGQQRLKLALDIKRKLKNKKKTYLFYATI